VHLGPSGRACLGESLRLRLEAFFGMAGGCATGSRREEICEVVAGGELADTVLISILHNMLSTVRGAWRYA